MTADPVVDEVRAIRDSIARAHNYSIEAIFRMLRELEAKRKSESEATVKTGDAHEAHVPTTRRS